MIFKEHDTVVLTSSLPGDGLETGDVGAIVHVHGAGESFEVEFITLTGETVAIATVPGSQLRAVNRRDVAHVRVVSTI